MAHRDWQPLFTDVPKTKRNGAKQARLRKAPAAAVAVDGPESRKMRDQRDGGLPRPHATTTMAAATAVTRKAAARAPKPSSPTASDLSSATMATPSGRDGFRFTSVREARNRFLAFLRGRPQQPEWRT